MAILKAPDLPLEMPVLQNTPRQPVNAGGYKIVSVRLREAEFVSFSEQAHAHSLTTNMALRIAARRIAGFLEVDANTRETLQEISRSIGEIASNLNSMRNITLRTGSPSDIAALTELRVAFGREFSRLDFLLQRILTLSKRRRDGRALLGDATDLSDR